MWKSCKIGKSKHSCGISLCICCIKTWEKGGETGLEYMQRQELHLYVQCLSFQGGGERVRSRDRDDKYSKKIFHG